MNARQTQTLALIIAALSFLTSSFTAFAERPPIFPRKTATPITYSEVLIALDDSTTYKTIAAIPLAPGGELELLDDGRKVKAQLSDTRIETLRQSGTRIEVLRSFVLIEGGASKPAPLLGFEPQATASYEYYSSGYDVYIPDYNGTERWVYSPILIDTAPWDARVISIDVHLDIYHPWIADVVVDLTDDAQIVNYNLYDEPYIYEEDLHLTETGIDAFNGLDVNQEWDLWAIDLDYGDSGYIDYWWIKVYYDDPPYIYAAEVSDLRNTTDADGDNYYEEFDFDIEIDADYPPGTTSVAAYITCLTTGQIWEISPWTIHGTDYDWVSVHFDESDFAGEITGRTSLYFEIELTDMNHFFVYDTDDNLPGEPVRIEPEIVITYRTLSLAKNGDGTVEVDGTARSLPWSDDYVENDIVNLEAFPAVGWLFDGWTGVSNPTYNPVAVIMNTDKSIIASFVADTADTDGDGMSNYDEAIAGTDSGNPDSLFEFSLISTPSSGTATISWPSCDGRVYAVYYSDDPVGPSMTWSLAQSNIPASGTGTNTWTDNGSLTGTPPGSVPRRYYRLSVSLQ